LHFFSALDLGDSGATSQKVDHQLSTLSVAALAIYLIALLISVALSQVLAASTFLKFMAFKSSQDSREKVSELESD